MWLKASTSDLRQAVMVCGERVLSVVCCDPLQYDPQFGDAFWNSSKYNIVSYLLRLMTSWAIVCNVWYMPPMVRKVISIWFTDCYRRTWLCLQVPLFTLAPLAPAPNPPLPTPCLQIRVLYWTFVSVDFVWLDLAFSDAAWYHQQCIKYVKDSSNYSAIHSSNAVNVPSCGSKNFP